MEVIQLLESQNRCLRKFLQFSENFLSQSIRGDFSELHSFENRREVFIKTITLYDQKIAQVISCLPPAEKTRDLVNSVQSVLKIKEDIVYQILKNDEKIVLEIEKEQSRLTQELMVSDKSNQFVRKFKSTWISESGETLDGKI